MSNPPIPTYRIPRIEPPSAPLPLDSNAAPWSAAPAITPFIRADGKSPARLATVAKVLWDSQSLHVLFECVDNRIWGTMLKDNDPLYDEEVVEIFLDPEQAATRYFEFEVSPRNARFAATIANFDPPKSQYTCNLDMSKLESRVFVDGRLSDPTEPDREWRAYMRIPFAMIGRPTPAPGEQWKANFFRIDRGAEDEYSCWSPTMTDPAAFHIPARFGVLEFGK